MNNSFRNIVLIVALGVVAIMCVGLYLYDYIPSGLTVSKASEYDTAASTTEILSDVKEAQELLTSQTTSTSSKSGTSPVVKTNIVLKEYDVSKTDIAIAKSTGELVQGRADPFAEVPTTTTQQDVAAGTTTTPNTNTSSDGTFYNSTKTK